MKLSLILLIIVSLAAVSPVQAQKKRTKPNGNGKYSTRSRPGLPVGIIVDERLSVLRLEPNLYANSIQRMRTGRIVSISGTRQTDGVIFYRITGGTGKAGWVQAEALIIRNEQRDDERLFRLIQVSKGFEQLERGQLHLENFPNSRFRSAVLLLLGDIIEEFSVKLSRDAARQLDEREMSSTGAPLLSFFLNHKTLDRFRKIGVNFWFNSATKRYHYNGAMWREILKKFPGSNEAIEAEKRLGSLKDNIEKKF